LPQGYEPLLKTQQRLWDRSLICHADLSGEFALQQLAKALEINLSAPGKEERLETLNLCRWNNPRLLQDWWDAAPEEAKIQRTLILSVELLRAHSKKILQTLSILPAAGRIEF